MPPPPNELKKMAGQGLDEALFVLAKRHNLVSEVFIGDYLNLLSHETTIQPFNRLTVRTPRHDELAHGSIFKALTGGLYGSLTRHEREFFVEVLPQPVRWFANVELDVWQAMLRQIGFRAT